MAIYENSRYTNIYTFEEQWKGKQVTAFNIRNLIRIDTKGSRKHIWIEGDRLDILAHRYYGDPQYWWFILDANKRYMEEHEIKNGDTLLIPPYSELRRIITDNE